MKAITIAVASLFILNAAPVEAKSKCNIFNMIDCRGSKDSGKGTTKDHGPKEGWGVCNSRPEPDKDNHGCSN